MDALRVIRAEHRSLAAVIHGLVYLVRDARAHAAPPDFALLATMLRYIESFPERFHHPKEDAWLFARLRLRDPDAAPLLDRLAFEHVDGARRIRELDRGLADWCDAATDAERGPAARERFRALVDAYAAFHWEHMRQEELEVMPRCVARLTARDWDEIDSAFAENADPLSDTGQAAEFAQLFSLIVASAPPPVGTGKSGEPPLPAPSSGPRRDARRSRV